jgi:PST family polysaccharide transporter
LRDSTTTAIVALYGALAVRYLLPLAVIPFLARMLGAEVLGEVVVVQAWGGLVAQVLEYGFGMTRTKLVAEAGHDRARLGELLGGTLAAQLVLAAAVALSTPLVAVLMPSLGMHTAWLILGSASGVFTGSSPLWFLRGAERMRAVASLDVLTRTLRVAGVFLFVRGPADAWFVFASDFFASLASLLLSAGFCRALVTTALPTWPGAKLALAEGASIFVMRMSAVGFSSGVTLVLGTFAPLSVVACYAYAEKIISTARAMFTPVLDAFFPRLGRQAAADPRLAARSVRQLLIWLTGPACLLSAALFFGAPLIIRAMFGPGFEPAVSALKVMAFIPPVVNINLCLGSHWLYVRGYVKTFVSYGVIGIVATLALTALLTARFPTRGAVMAGASYLAAQTLIAIALAVKVRRVGLVAQASAPSGLSP